MSNDNSTGAYPGSGSIYEIAQQQGISQEDLNQPMGHTGLTRGEYAQLHSEGSGGQAVSARSGGAPDIGGFKATTPAGDPIINARDLRPDSVVTVMTPFGPQTTTYDVALQARLLNSNNQPQGQPQARQQEDQQEDDHQQDQQEENTGNLAKADDAVSMAKEAEDIMRYAIDADEGATIAAAADVINSEDATVGEDAVARIASAFQTDREGAKAYVETAVRGYQDDAFSGAARHAGTDAGLASEALFDAKTNRRSDLNRAMTDHFQRGGTRAYAPLVLDYVATLDSMSPERVASAECAPGIAVRSEGNYCVVTVGGQTFQYESAVRNGFIRVSTGRRGPGSIRLDPAGRR